MLRFVGLAGLASVLFWLGYFAWWPAIIPAAGALGLAFCQCRNSWTCGGAALAGCSIAWRPLQDSLTVYSPFGIYTLLGWQAITFIPVALSLRWGWRRGFRMVWFFPLIWVGGEYLRMLGPLGFPFGSLALPAYEQRWLIQITDLGGLHLVSAVLASGSGLLLDGWRTLSLGKGESGRRALRPSTAGFVGVMILVSAYGGFRQQQIESSLQPGPWVAVIQPDIPLTGNRKGDYDGMRLLRELQGMSEEAAKSDPRPQLIVWPEAFADWPLPNPEYIEQPFTETLFPIPRDDGPGETRAERAQRWDARRSEFRKEAAAFRSWVAELGIPVLMGQATWLPVERDGDLVFEEYNAARLIRPQENDRVERQFKVRLFPGGEYVPGGRARLQFLAGISASFSTFLDSVPDIQPGTHRKLFLLPPPDTDSPGASSTPFFVSICSEILFPESAGAFDFQERFPLHINIMNTGLFQRNRAQLIPYMALPFRAIEARRPIACSANTGISCFVSPTGKISGQVTNADGDYRTGLGFAERAAIDAFDAQAPVFAENPSDPHLRAERIERVEEIHRLRAQAGVSGFSVCRVDFSHHRPFYPFIGQYFSWFTLMALLLGTAASFAPRSLRDDQKKTG